VSTPERVPIAQLRDLLVPGEPLPFRIVDGQGRLLLAAGQRIADADQLLALLERGASAEPEEVAQVRRQRSGAAGAGPVPSHRRATWFDAWERQVWGLDKLLRSLGQDPQQHAALETFADTQLRLIDKHPDAALFMAVRQDDRRFALYALTHALHTATVATLTAQLLGWPTPRVRSLALAALTMNASMVELQGHMAEQSDPPTKRQIDEIRAHPQRSAELLRASGVTDADWLTAVEDHHERRGGSGYPRGLQAVGEPAHVLRAADVFAAKISPRALRASLRPQVAARQLFQDEAGGAVAGALIKAVGVYPPGEFVTLRSGETAVVVRRAQAGNTPEVAVLLNAQGRAPNEVMRRDTAQPEHSITGLATPQPGWPRVLPEQVYGLLEP
jgi:hypothetical protein